MVIFFRRKKDAAPGRPAIAPGSEPESEPVPPPPAAATPLAVELGRLDWLLGRHLRRLRQHGRGQLGDPIGGSVIEEGEADGLLRWLHADHRATGVDDGGSDETASALAPLERARQLFGLTAAERDFVLFALAGEVDGRYGRLVALLNDHVRRTRPTVGLALQVLAPDSESTRRHLLERLSGEGPLRRYALIHLQGEDAFADRTISVPAELWPRLIGLAPPPPPALSTLCDADLGHLELDPRTRSDAEAAAGWARHHPGREVLIVISGPPESGRKALARAIAGRLRPQAMVVGAMDCEAPDALAALARDARWYDAAIIVGDADRVAPAVRKELLRGADALVLLVTEEAGRADILHQGHRRTIEVTVPERDGQARARLWDRLLPDRRAVPGFDSEALATRYGFGPARMLSAIRIARAHAEVHGRTGPHQGDIEAACRYLRQTRFGDLAEKLPCPFDVSDIVLPQRTRHELDLIVAWTAYGARLFGRGGRGERLQTGTGLACLFSGPPGTGKTMAAQIIARRIDWDIYRIDLSQVVNKYIGETEKNLAKVFAEAQRSKVILFFDEADALFGRRSEVKDAHDRYANIESGYLLQRLESYAGLAILATNLPKNLDDAFLRRLQVRAEFPMPAAAERREIWDRLIPRGDDRDRDVDLALLSERFEVAGGTIRNAVFTALLIAAEENQAVGMRHLVLGLWRELEKLGRVLDLAQFGGWREAIEDAWRPRRRHAGSPVPVPGKTSIGASG